MDPATQQHNTNPGTRKEMTQGFQIPGSWETGCADGISETTLWFRFVPMVPVEPLPTKEPKDGSA